MSPSVFGKVQLGYVVIETEKFSEWRRFGRDGRQSQRLYS